ncbi:MAG: hypothetical protein J6T02_05830 [Bacteroidales bacterium]|nr:hypothetical protein [Bacteroidales bacterium]
MKRLLVAAIAAIFLLAVSCKEDSVLMYNVITFGDMVDGAFITDRGLTYHITTRDCDEFPEDQTRFLIVCDVLKKLSDTEYNIRLTSYLVPLVKAPVDEGTIPEEELGDDPINVGTGWISAGYLNIQGLLYFKQIDGAKHVINLVREEGPFPDDTLYYRLHHNANGEYPGGEISMDEMVYGYVYCCFPIADDLPEEKESMPVKLSWKWLVEGTSEDPYPTAIFSSKDNTLTR